MSYFAIAVPLTLGLMLGMLFLLEFGRRLARRDSATGEAATGTLDSAVFALLGLLLAFTFSGALQRFDTRRAQIVEETNNIGTAWLRVDLLPADTQPALRDLFKRYVDSRLEIYSNLQDIEATSAEFQHSNALQSEIWNRAVAACNEKRDPAATTLVIDALNTMFDITTTRAAAARMHPPLVVFALLFLLALASAFVAGHGMASAATAPWLHMLTFAAMISASVYLVLDLEYPRAGFVRIDGFDQTLADLRRSMRRVRASEKCPQAQGQWPDRTCRGGPTSWCWISTGSSGRT